MKIIPDPTTAGDFLRHFDEQDILALIEAKNNVRQRIWKQQPANFKKEAILNVDGMKGVVWMPKKLIKKACDISETEWLFSINLRG